MLMSFTQFAAYFGLSDSALMTEVADAEIVNFDDLHAWMVEGVWDRDDARAYNVAWPASKREVSLLPPDVAVGVHVNDDKDGEAS